MRDMSLILLKHKFCLESLLVPLKYLKNPLNFRFCKILKVVYVLDIVHNDTIEEEFCVFIELYPR
jgi:hypothetical protein